jgi:hypothetical protein
VGNREDGGERERAEDAGRPRFPRRFVVACVAVGLASFAAVPSMPEGSAWQTVFAAVFWAAVLAALARVGWWTARLLLRARPPSPRYRLEPAAWPDGPDGPPAAPVGDWSRPELHRVGRVGERWATTDGRSFVRVLGPEGWSRPMSRSAVSVPFTPSELLAAIVVGPLWYLATMALFVASQATHGAPAADAGGFPAAAVAVGMVAGGVSLVVTVWLVRHHGATRAAVWPAILAAAD